MITIKEAEEVLKKEYERDNYLVVLDDILLPDFKKELHPVEFNNSLFQSITELGESKTCEVTIYEVILKEGAEKRRVAITQEMFRVLRGQAVNNAIVAFSNADRRHYRFSLLTSKYEFDGNKVVKILSNPRRYSYSLGYETKTKTAYKFLIEKGKVNSLEDLISRFSVEVVNKEFYKEIALSFTELIGGERDGKTFEKELNIYGVADRNKYAEFAVRLIGRIMFCWFLKEKKSEEGNPLIPTDILKKEKISGSHNYYHDILEPLFFELLNTNQKRRKGKFLTEEIFKQIPYLNGGLFSPHTDDHYKYDTANQCGQYGIVTISNEWFERFYGILSQYNFTVDENTAYDIELSIDPEMLGRIFENLLAEINPETGENAKKSTGSFYTPRDIVDYMVDNSILEYLKTKTEIDEVKLKALISYSKEDDDLAVFDETEKKKIVDALYNVKVLDPACGSGAFPIGMLQKIVYMLQEIDPEANMWFDEIVKGAPIYVRKAFEEKFSNGELNYIRKLTVIEKSIYGIDIQPIAVEIARLRCFLSLVIEQKVNDKEENRGVHPLPSLDFKFIIANSLIKLDGQIDSKYNGNIIVQSLFESGSDIDALKNIREEYFNADSERKTELKLEFKNIQQDMLIKSIDNYNKEPSPRYRQLSSWKPFENEATSWFDPEWMFGIKDGFDIVIGNPPYIQLQKAISKDSKVKLGDLYQNCKFDVFEKTGDIYCLFYEKGNTLLKENGILTYITSNKWMRAGYGEKLRGYLATNTNPILLLDFCGQKVFDTATVDVNILIFAKQKNQGKTIACTANEKCRENLSVFVEQNQTIVNFETSDNWVILSSIEQSIKNKIETYGVPLKDWDISINYGIKTGFNEAFIIDQTTRDNLIAQDEKSAEIIRPILRGKDIKRYSYDYKNLYLICTFPSLHIDIEKYPAIKSHLLSFGKERLEQTGCTYIVNNEKITSRKKTTNKWFETQDSISYWDDFNKQKIMYPCIMASEPSFILDDNIGFYTPAPGNIITGNNLEWLIAFLNSKIVYFALRKYYMGGGIEGELKTNRLEILPVPKVNQFNDTIIKLIQNISDSSISQIESIVSKAYNLSDEEFDYICSLNNIAD